MSRLHGGIHFHFDDDDVLVLGKHVFVRHKASLSRLTSLGFLAFEVKRSFIFGEAIRFAKRMATDAHHRSV